MKYMLDKVAITLTVAVISGCAQTSGYRPVIDPYADPRPAFLQQDVAQCEQIAKENASVGKDTLIQGGTGALIGGATGAAMGAIFGNPAVGAAAGGAIGGIGGAAKGGFQADETYKRIFRNCMRGRGHQVLD